MWYALIAAAVLLAASGYVVVRRRYNEARRQLVFQIQSVVDLEARAFAENDRELFLAQQDQTINWWYEEQQRRISPRCQRTRDSLDRWPDPCFPVLPARVEDIDMRGSVVLAKVTEGQPPVRRARFYRRTFSGGWQHTAPDAAFWEPIVETHYEGLRVRCRRRDLSYVYPLLEPIADVMSEICTSLVCSPEYAPVIEFAVRRADEVLPRLENTRIVLDTPWLIGIPANAAASRVYLDNLAHLTAQAAVYAAMRVTPEHGPDPLQQAVASEYVAWYEQGSTAQAPLLRRIAERHGVDALAEVVRSAAETPSLNAFLGKWLDLLPTEQESAFFQALLDIEREAILAGAKDTFMLLQHISTTWPRSRLESHFDQGWESGSLPWLPVFQVERVSRTDGFAYVTARTNGGHVIASYRLRDDGWRHDDPSFQLARSAGWQVFRGVSSADTSQPTNLDFEAGMRGWSLTGTHPQEYQVGTDGVAAHSDHFSGYIRSHADETAGFGTLMQSFPADEYRGKRVRMSAYVRTEEVKGWVGLWMRVDGTDGTLALDNMQDRPIRNVTDWTRYEVVMDVRQDSVNISFGILVAGTGQAWVDDFVFEVVGQDVPTTG